MTKATRVRRSTSVCHSPPFDGADSSSSGSTATCFIVSDQSKAAEVNNYSEPAPDLNAKAYLSSLIRREWA